METNPNEGAADQNADTQVNDSADVEARRLEQEQRERAEQEAAAEADRDAEAARARAAAELSAGQPQDERASPRIGQDVIYLDDSNAEESPIERVAKVTAADYPNGLFGLTVFGDYTPYPLNKVPLAKIKALPKE